MRLSLAVVPGDGVGPEVTTRALDVLQAVNDKLGDSLNFNECMDSIWQVCRAMGRPRGNDSGAQRVTGRGWAGNPPTAST